MIIFENDWTFRAKITPQLATALRKAKIYFDFRENENRLMSGGVMIGGLKRANAEPYCCYGWGNNVFEMGAFSYARRELPVFLKVGRYSSIGPDVSAPQGSHPLNYVTTSPITYDKNFAIVAAALKDREKTDHKFNANPQKQLPVLGNDVWIGEGATLMPGITVGNGAVIASCSVVTKSVPDYAIVAGNPATIKKFRFDEKIMERLLKTRWWDYHFADLGMLDFTEPLRFCDVLLERVENGSLAPWQPEKINIYELIKGLSQ
jgi:acetyltransferase-like isoleucine patch superfamily enzyme